MPYTQINKYTDHFNTKHYTGNGSVRTETGVGFEPSWTWIKDRTGTNAHVLTDAVRGANYQIYSNLTNAQTNASGYLTAFASDGFTLGTDGAVNQNGRNYASWNWKANGQGSSNTDGSINTIYTSANQTSGVSIIKYTGTGSNATVGHGLGVAPKMVILKVLSTNNDGMVGHSSLHATDAWDKYIYINDASAVADANTMWNDTYPTATTVSLGTHSYVNYSGRNYIMYCFAEKPGFSKIGKYTGNNSSSGVFVFTDFKPSFVMIKRIDASGDWRIYDTQRFGAGGPNNKLHYLEPNTSDAEASTDSGGNWDMLSNGFRFYTSEAEINGGGDYVYYAIGQSLVGSNNVPCTAR